MSTYLRSNMSEPFKFRSSCGQPQLLSTSALIDEGRVAEKVNEQVRSLQIFEKVYVDIFYAFIRYTQLYVNDYIVEQGIMQIARLDALISTALSCL